MFKKHLTIFLLLAIAATFSFGQSIPSGTGRIEALGNTPFILDAATDIFNNPSWTTYYKNYGFGDIGRGIIDDFRLSDQYAGFTMGVSKNFSLGLIGNKRSDRFNMFYKDGVVPSSLSQPIVPMMVLLGYSLSKNFHLGLAPYIARSSYKQTTTGLDVPDFDNSAMSLGTNLGFIYMVKKGWFEGNLKFRMNSFTYDSTLGDPAVQTKIENDGGMEFGANFRAWIYPSTSSKLAVVPVLGFNMFSWNPKSTIGGTVTEGTKHSFMSFFGGVGLNYPVLDDIQIAGGLLGKYDTYKYEFTDGSDAKETNFILPRIYLAAETRIADWLTGRVGFAREWNMWNVDFNATGVTNEYSGLSDDNTIDDPFNSTQTISLGTGFHFGRFSIDATVSEKWLKEGINFVSGGDTDLFGVISASYNFNAK